ncbi:glycosyltransferase [Vibrio vulnificus]|nr:glycosyltransferase [Vibrio vulnificus]
MSHEEQSELRSFCTYEIIPFKFEGGVLGRIKKSISPRRYYSIEFKNAVQSALSTYQPDAVFVEQTFMSQYVTDFIDFPKVMSSVDAISFSAFLQSELEPSAIKSFLLKFVGAQRRLIEWYYFSKFSTITTVSFDDSHKLSKVVGKDVKTIPNGVDADFFFPLKYHNRDTLVFTGVLSNPGNEEACIFLLEKVFPVIKNKLPKIKFVVAGRKPTKMLVSAIPDYVQLMPDVDDLRDAFTNALCFLAPIEIGAGIKNNVLQAMAMGVPVLTNNLVAGAINITDNETGFIEDDRNNYCDRLLYLLSQTDRLEVVGLKGREHILEHFSWDSVALKYISLLESEIND